jgi:ribosomal protein L22
MNLQKAFTYLNNVTEHKQVIPFRRFAGGIGRASQAKEFKTTKGEFAFWHDGNMAGWGIGGRAQLRWGVWNCLPANVQERGCWNVVEDRK